MSDFDQFLDALGIPENASVADIGEALRKAAITTGTSASAMLSAQQSRNFLTAVTDADRLGPRIRTEFVDVAASEIDKIGIAAGVIRAASENADDGYRAEPTFGTVPFVVKTIRLPWEITLPFLKNNLEGQSVEDKIWTLMTGAFGRDLSRLDLLGDPASGDASLSINTGVLKQAAVSGVAHRVNLGNTTFGSTYPNKAHFFALVAAMPDKYKDQEGDQRPVFIGSPSNREAYQEYLTDRATGAGDQALQGGGSADLRPLGYEYLPVGNMPSNRILFTAPRNIVRVLQGDVERYRVGPDTDWELATRRKKGYVFFVDHDTIVEEMDALVDGYNVGVAA